MADDDQKIVNYHTDEPTISSDTTPTMYERVRSEPWFSWAVRILAAVIIILVLVFGGRWLHHKLENKTSNTGTNSSANQTRPNFSKTNSANSAKNSNSSSKAGNSSSKSSTGSGSASTATGPSLKSGDNDQLANTGPGDVVAIFLAASFAVAALHYAYEISKNS